jgi:hypothetical protein
MLSTLLHVPALWLEEETFSVLDIKRYGLKSLYLKVYFFCLPFKSARKLPESVLFIFGYKIFRRWTTFTFLLTAFLSVTSFLSFHVDYIYEHVSRSLQKVISQPTPGVQISLSFAVDY